MTKETKTPLGEHCGDSLKMCGLSDGGVSLTVPQGHSKDGTETVHHETLQMVDLWF